MDRLISENTVMEVIYGCDWFIDENTQKLSRNG